MSSSRFCSQDEDDTSSVPHSTHTASSYAPAGEATTSPTNISRLHFIILRPCNMCDTLRRTIIVCNNTRIIYALCII